MKGLPSNLPDDRNWVFIDAVGLPVAPGVTPLHAKLPMSEVARIFELVTYLNVQLEGCNALGSANP